ncbi:MAG: TetR family transcriptional regulator [Bryobacteraceae bacterium]
MPSHIARAPRRIPRQDRGERRVAALLQAAASVLAERGYDAATMSEVANRAGASIGSLYQFFPDKQSVAEALRVQFGEEIERLWSQLEAQAKSLSLASLSDRLIEVTLAFVAEHPAFLALLDAPRATRNRPVRRRLLALLGRLFQAKRPRLRRDKAVRMAAVTLEIMKAMNAAYAQAPRAERAAWTREYKAVLRSYWTAQIAQGERSARRTNHP